ncbi:MAG TPA: zf-HC2 domain-containing protein [Ignavibacteriaceae bacterium]
MKKYNSKYEILSAYIDGELSPDEARELEEKIKFSKELQDKLEELKKIKNLTVTSVKRLQEAPYFETRLAANLNHKGLILEKFRKWTPAIGFTALAVGLMIFLKFNPGVIDELVEQQKTNLAGFYQENLRPLFFASDLSKEDIFNFAFSKQLPLDREKGQYLKLGYDDAGKEFFEIKTAGSSSPINNLERFAATLKLNSKQKQQVDSILESYAGDLQTQVLVNDKNTVAINPNLWNYNKAIVADIMSFARDANREEFNKIVPAGYFVYDNPDVRTIVNKVKDNKDNNYIFFTPDTIFTERFNFDKKKFEKEMAIAKEEMQKGMEEADRSLKNLRIDLKLDSNLAKLKSEPSWDNNFKVYIDSNICRVHISKIDIPDFHLPDFDSISAQVEEAMKNIPPIIIDVPGGRGQKTYSFKYEYSDTTGRVKIPDIDSLLKSMGIFQGDSLIYNRKGSHYFPDSLTSSFRIFGDSTWNFNDGEFKREMKKLQKEMDKMKEEMKRLRIEIHQDTLKNEKKGTSIEI